MNYIFTITILLFLGFDPCEEGRQQCNDNSVCVVEGETFRCICNPGYQYTYIDDVQVCVDVDECKLEIHDCDYNARCVNEIGNFACVCHPGFNGDGHVCNQATSCEGVECPENSECVLDGVARCACLPGFQGNAIACYPIQSISCNLANNCSPYGYCSINPATNLYACNCLHDYEGDGYTCTPKPTPEPPTTKIPETTEMVPDNYKIARCIVDRGCWCEWAGYKLLEGTKYCVPDEDENYTTEEGK